MMMSQDANKSISSLVDSISTVYPTADRFVLYLDIMGFKDRVARNSHTEILKGLEALSNFISDNISPNDGLLFTMFSDSIIILSSDIEYKIFVVIVQLSNAIINKSIELAIPIKGALASGKCTVCSGQKSLYFGQPIIDAYLLEENIELYNVALHHTVEEYAYQLFAESSHLLFDYEVKLKGGMSKHYVLGWFVNDIDKCRENLRMIRTTVSDSPRRYIDNTLKCIAAFQDSFSNL